MVKKVFLINEKYLARLPIFFLDSGFFNYLDWQLLKKEIKCILDKILLLLNFLLKYKYILK